METDIVERLRAVAAMDLRTGPFLAHTLDTAKEAAAEIENLRRNLALRDDFLGEVGQWEAFVASLPR